MPSLPQINANRRNSQKSTGPRTEAGKAVSSRNALKSGIYADGEVIYGEEPADLAALADEYYLHHHPESPAARALVDILIHSEWILRRLRRVETQLWERDIDHNHDDEDGKDSLGFAFNRNEGKVYSRLQRRIDSTQRNFQRALKDLQKLQGGGLQPAQGFSPAPEPRIQPQSAQAPEIGFVPSTPQPQPDTAAIRRPTTHPDTVSATYLVK